MKGTSYNFLFVCFVPLLAGKVKPKVYQQVLLICK